MQKIDLVYNLGNGSHWSDNELRLSLRSVEKNFNLVGKVFIIGEKPEWLTNVIHIPCADKYQNKILNARVKYEVAANDKRISQNFILMNDDFFFIKRVENIDYFSRGTLAEMIELHPTKGGYYYKSLCVTDKRLKQMGIEKPIDYEIHAPIIFDKEKLITTIALIGDGDAYSIRSCYGNLNCCPPVKLMDFKAANMNEFIIQSRRTDARFLSINDAIVADEYFRDWIISMFPNKSKYEIDEKGLRTKPGRPLYKREYHALQSFEFNSRRFSKGDILPKQVIEKIKDNPKMAYLYIFS